MTVASSTLLLLLVGFFSLGTEAKSDCLHSKFKHMPNHTACAAKSPLATPLVVTEADKKEILDAHNKFRGTVEPAVTFMMKLYWDDELAALAQKLTDTCKTKDKETDRYIPGLGIVGRNSISGKTFIQGINEWKKETGKALSKRQMLWTYTSTIGCGATKCGDNIIRVCNYYPEPWTYPYIPYNAKGTRCSGCKTCSDGLCDCGGLTCRNGGEILPKTCTCWCPDVGYLWAQPDCHTNCTAPNEDPFFDCGYDPGKVDCYQPFLYGPSCPFKCGACPDVDPNYKPPKDDSNEDKNAEEEDRKAEEEDRKAEEEDRKAEEEDRKAEEEDRKAEEEDRKADNQDGKKSCETGWSMNSATGRCYKYRKYKGKSTYEPAHKDCKDLGGELASASDQAEFDFVFNLIKDDKSFNENSGWNGIWLGATNVASAGFKWADGSDVTWGNWHPGKPDRRSCGTLCLVMRGNTGKWSDANCRNKRWYRHVCMKNP